ncbi:MAG TPA: VOC family protein, partial [Ilumatobacteraceae bacterium]|nr:VOC family protein [Ilumatobacteraceae bacterium]
AGVYVALYPREGNGPKLLLQRVTEPKATKNRMHLDIEVPEIDVEADRLTGLGALRVSDDTCSEHGSTWILMADPEGNEFCICDNGSPATTETT